MSLFYSQGTTCETLKVFVPKELFHGLRGTKEAEKSWKKDWKLREDITAKGEH